METLQEQDLVNDYEEEFSVVHAWMQRRVLQILFRSVQREYEVLSFVSFQTTATTYTPDICLYPKQPLDILDDSIAEKTAPILAIEIASASQSNAVLIRKCIDMINAGVETCWIVEPPTGVVIICDKNGRTVLRKGEFLHHPLLSDPISIDEIFDLSA